MMKRRLIDIAICPLILIGAFVLMVWLIIVRLIDLGGDIWDYLAGKRKPCDKEPAKQRPRRAF